MGRGGSLGKHGLRALCLLAWSATAFNVDFLERASTGRTLGTSWLESAPLRAKPAPAVDGGRSGAGEGADADRLISAVDDLLKRSGSGVLENRGSVLHRVDERAATDAVACSALAAETDPSTASSIDYEWIFAEASGGGVGHRQRHPIAIRTVGNEAILNSTSIRLIRSAAEERWAKAQEDEEDGARTRGAKTSRFTYQRRGNYEAHLNDLAIDDPALQWVANDMLSSRVYPLVRDAFDGLLADEDLDSLRFCVYDSLVIRYNASEACNGLTTALKDTGDISRARGAGQPLHRDLGLVSINIMLNSHGEFEGGGTFFESQLLGLDSLEELKASQGRYKPLKPGRPGHALAHLSSERHAGSSTVRGLRDILVVFVTGTRTREINGDGLTPLLERSARLKSLARPQCECLGDDANSALCRAFYHRLAVEFSPQDGEGWHYLGIALKDYHSYGGVMNTSADMVQQLGLDCLGRARQLNSCDGRVYNNLGLWLGQMFMKRRAENLGGTSFDGLDDLCLQVSQTYARGSLLHRAAEMSGSDVGHEHDACVLNHGVFLSLLDDFEGAISVLSGLTGPLTRSWEVRNDADGCKTHLRILNDAGVLLRFCERRHLEESRLTR